VVLIIVGAFFTVNLALAVLYLQFTHSQLEIEVEREDAEQAALVAAAAAKAARAVSAAVSSPSKVIRHIASFTLAPSRMPDDNTPGCLWGSIKRIMHLLQHACKAIEKEPNFEILTLCLISLNTAIMASEYHRMAGWHSKV
jgi:hypothetical protein